VGFEGDRVPYGLSTSIKPIFVFKCYFAIPDGWYLRFDCHLEDWDLPRRLEDCFSVQIKHHRRNDPICTLVGGRGTLVQYPSSATLKPESTRSNK